MPSVIACFLSLVNRSYLRGGKILPLSSAEAADACRGDGLSAFNLDSDDIWKEEAEIMPSRISATVPSRCGTGMSERFVPRKRIARGARCLQLKIRSRRKHHVEAAKSREHSGFERLVGVEIKSRGP
jgi:hypothetical protein